ncbi:uncharacterized protein DS421_12g354730 [Arachis hypogaea]|nr:uncharacterized protein DS421_12g354730 [Arachis hypogaea]
MMGLRQQTLIRISLTRRRRKMISLRRKIQLPTVNLGSEPLLQTQASSTPSVNSLDNTRFPFLKTNSNYSTLTSSLFTFRRAPIALSLPSSLKEELMKDDLSMSLRKPCKKAPTQQLEQQKQATEESSPRNTEPEPPMNVPPKEQQQPCQEATVARQLEEEPWDKSPNISTNSPSQIIVTQPTHPSEPTVLELEILEEAVVDARVTVALKFAEATTADPTVIAAETKDSSNEYDAIFVLKHEANYEGIRQHFISLMPKEQVESTMFMLENYGMDYTNPNTKKAYRFDIDQYAHHCRFLDKRKFALHPFLFVPICNRGHWWLWIAYVKKKAFYVLDPVNKKKKGIPESRVKLNKFIMRVYAGPEPLMEDREGEEAEYIVLNGQRTDYDCGIYIMKWLKTIDPRNIKSGKRYRYKAWTQKEIDGFRHEYGPNLLMHE